MKNITEVQITKTLKYEALYIILGFDEIKDGIFQKNIPITLSQSIQTI